MTDAKVFNAWNESVFLGRDIGLKTVTAVSCGEGKKNLVLLPQVRNGSTRSSAEERKCKPT